MHAAICAAQIVKCCSSKGRRGTCGHLSTLRDAITHLSQSKHANFNYRNKDNKLWTGGFEDISYYETVLSRNGTYGYLPVILLSEHHTQLHLALHLDKIPNKDLWIMYVTSPAGEYVLRNMYAKILVCNGCEEYHQDMVHTPRPIEQNDEQQLQEHQPALSRPYKVQSHRHQDVTQQIKETLSSVPDRDRKTIVDILSLPSRRHQHHPPPALTGPLLTLGVKNATKTRETLKKQAKVMPLHDDIEKLLQQDHILLCFQHEKTLVTAYVPVNILEIDKIAMGKGQFDATQVKLYGVRNDHPLEEGDTYSATGISRPYILRTLPKNQFLLFGEHLSERITLMFRKSPDNTKDTATQTMVPVDFPSNHTYFDFPKFLGQEHSFGESQTLPHDGRPHTPRPNLNRSALINKYAGEIQKDIGKHLANHHKELNKRRAHPTSKTANSYTQTTTTEDAAYIRGERLFHNYTTSQLHSTTGSCRIVPQNTSVERVYADGDGVVLTEPVLRKLKHEQHLCSYAVSIYEVTGESGYALPIADPFQLKREKTKLWDMVLKEKIGVNKATQ